MVGRKKTKISEGRRLVLVEIVLGLRFSCVPYFSKLPPFLVCVVTSIYR
jgi:hypothetical protein